MNKVILKINVPESVCPVRLDLPAISLNDAISYELEEMCRVQSFERRHNMTMREALSDAPALVGIALDCADARGGEAGR